MIEEGSPGALGRTFFGYLTRSSKIEGGDIAASVSANDDAVMLKEIRNVSGLPLSFLEGMPDVTSPEDVGPLAVKRAVDIILSVLALVFLAPLLLLVALAIRITSRGPAVFHQVREGQRGELIAIYKFRSMYADRCDATGVRQTSAGDGRVTLIGKFIRRTSIDELPQLFNVLRGDMSLIGPRPHVPGMLAGGVRYDELVPYYHVRGLMRPGLSGWAQANGFRGATDDIALARARVDHDLAYIANFSIWLDLKIIARTLARELSGGSGS